MISNVDKNNHEGGIDFEEFIELLVNHGRNLDEDIAKSFKVSISERQKALKKALFWSKM